MSGKKIEKFVDQSERFSMKITESSIHDAKPPDQLGKTYKDYPGQEVSFRRCVCGLMVLTDGPCVTCLATPAARYTLRPRWAPRDRVPMLSVILCLVILGWFAGRVDQASPERGAMMELD